MSQRRSEIDCTMFDRGLDELLAGDVPDPEREGRLRALEVHARDCARCRRAGGDLLALLGLPAGERDLVDDPGEAYWATFDARLRRRIEREGAIEPSPRRAGWLGLAAAIVLGLLAVWLLRDAVRPAPDEPATAIAEVEPADDAVPPELDALLSAVPADAALGEVDLVTGFGDDGWPAAGESWDWSIPSADELAPEVRRELLDWLREQTDPKREVRS